jgi:hypothetical protein
VSKKCVIVKPRNEEAYAPEKGLLSHRKKKVFILPIPVSARSKAWIYGRSLAGIAGSNPAGFMDVWLL